LSVDPLVDETGQPYAYTEDDPVDLTDPSGLIAIDAQSDSLAPICSDAVPYQPQTGVWVTADILSGTGGGGEADVGAGGGPVGNTGSEPTPGASPADEDASPPRFIAEPNGTVIDRDAVSDTISMQRQLRHVAGTAQYNSGGYFVTASDAQTVLDDFHSGEAEVLGTTRGGGIIVRDPSVLGFNNSQGTSWYDQPTDVFVIKGTSRVSVFPTSPLARGSG
jgi:hypothetical protein